jgi:hypothetical protein
MPPSGSDSAAPTCRGSCPGSDGNNKRLGGPAQSHRNAALEIGQLPMELPADPLERYASEPMIDR